jgi:multidrug efflux pump subunit AcrA (membrane-fusion protein)
MNKKRNGKKIWIMLICVILALAIAGGCCWFFLGRTSEPVAVFPFYYFGMTEYWGDSMESYGPVSTDKIQTVFLSGTQTVNEIFVNLGDEVKKGDLLMRFDTTLTDIALERERLGVEKLKLELEDAQKELRRINAMKPMQEPKPPEEEPEEDLGVTLLDALQFSPKKEFNGTAAELSMICWLRSDTQIDEDLFDLIRLQADAYRSEEVPVDPEPATEDAPEESTESEAPVIDPNVYYVIFKITEDDRALAPATTWQGLVLTYAPETRDYRFSFFDASGVKDHMIPETEPPQEPEFDFGSGFTAAQIAQMRAQQEKVIRDLQFQVKMAEAEYKIKQAEMSDGNIYAQIDGTVVSLLSPEEAQMSQQPVLKVSGGGGFYVTVTVGELDKEKLAVGQEVTVNDWNTGMTYVGTVQSIADYPVNTDQYSGMGNPNVSYYPFTVFVDGSADLQEGSFVSVLYAASDLQTGVYLENPFLRTENGQTYVYVRAADGTLEKRFVTTGKSLWGSYTQILEGLTAEDFIAFPYGKNLKPGAPTVESDPSALYGY